jgi:hypothetical protein
MENLIIIKELRDFINFCSKNTEVKSFIASQKNGIRAVEELALCLEGFAKDYVLSGNVEVGKSFQVGSLTEKTLIADKILKKLRLVINQKP